MSDGLFSRLQSYFDATYGGRYVGLLIKEAITENSKLAQELFGVAGFDRIEREYPIEVNGISRIADLALFSHEDSQPSCLVEIKYDDQDNPRNSAQLADYLRWCRVVRGRKFIYLTQHLPPDGDRRLLAKAGLRPILFSEAADHFVKDGRGIDSLLRRFFEDKGLIMHKFEVEEYENLRRLLIRFFNSGSGDKQVRTNAATGGGVADAFGHLLRNMNIISREVTARVEGRGPTTDFWLSQFIDPKNTISSIAKQVNSKQKNTELMWYSLRGGTLWISGTKQLGVKNKWREIEFGFALQTFPRKGAFVTYCFAQVYGRGLDDSASYRQKKMANTCLCDKAKAVLVLRKLIREAIALALKTKLDNNTARKLRDFDRCLHL